MVVSVASARAMIVNARRRLGKDAGDLLDALIKGEPYQTGSGAPTLTPRAIGERYYDSTNKVFYRAAGTTSSDWVQDGGVSTARLVAAGATLTLTKAAHDNKEIMLDTAAGSVCTLPAASGTGMKVRFRVLVLATSNSHIVKVANASDIIQGVINTIDTDTAGTTTGWASGAADDTITLNRSTTGSAMRGEWIELIDAATNLWLVTGQLANTGSGATPFSATV